MLTFATVALIASGAAIPVQRGYAPLDGLRMYYEIHGRGGVPLVLLHGGGSTIETSFGKLLPLPVFFEKSVQRMRHFNGWTREQIQSVRAPTLLLGDLDIVRVEHAAQMQRLLGDAQLAVLPGTDHLGIVARAAPVAAMVETFLGSAGRGRRVTP